MKVVIFCGGYGTRFWPISRKSTPKQFVPFLNGKSFFQLTYQRFRKQFAPEEIFVSTEENYTSFIRKQAPEVPRHNIISEPERKDLLAACGLATAVVNKYFPGESVLISWAKHLIARESVFLDAVMAAGDFADKTGLIVSVDSKPSYPSVHNGWVRLGKKIGRINEFNILQIEKHVEKPEKELAEKLFKEGGWLINTGYRVWKTDVMLSHYKKFQPKMYDSLMEIVEAWGTKKQDKVLKEIYHTLDKDSVEYGIFEKLPGDVRATIAADMGWEDVGISWELFYKSLITPKRKSIIEGGCETQLIDSENNLIIGSKGKMIAVIGLSDIAVIDTADGLLVCKLDQTQKVKDLYANLEHYYKEYTK
ncbi:MAG: Mannose-1-phosphate guanylyltransferase (GDP) [Candidatus Woesebacteria bacterium GW2011_GWD1_38_10]|uniref:Mannose-1-phosphate guanylyltransferase (GDP) n=2 Tax=Candidatus Woeseibacteriota TaxID=1752722 RepID=A0A0G0L618_9BACT|nr:MAG: Mannose-1-phosphate guanylyltransferase (GDP) [Candidatus Woesebacteria bacterium GW2011_GWD1_38_10]KKQ83290.1 MAG: Mannose-1-phosphate guanylyltransferase (GDP) [Candidatus Woesebacteria bacterium GW2011_GWA1_38_8]